MDYAACHVIYLDNRVSKDRCEQRDSTQQQSLNEPDDLQGNLRILMSTFNTVHVCSTGLACLNKIRELESIATDCTPTMVFLEISIDCHINEYLQSGYEHSTLLMDHVYLPNSSSGPGDFYGLVLLQHIASEISLANLSKLTVPIVVIRHVQDILEKEDSNALFLGVQVEKQNLALASEHVDTSKIMKFLEAGAVDVVKSPFLQERIEALAIHGYRAHIDGLKDQPTFVAMKRQRKRSWVGIDEEKPYAYLRESMVSTLMSNICKPESVLAKADHVLYVIDPIREAIIAQSIGSWAFAAHDFSDDELVHAAFLILQHALGMPELEKWRIPSDELKSFLVACRSAYNSFVLYHNFRHVIDVLQAVFYFLLQIGTLPPYPSTEHLEKHTSPIAILLKPFEAFILLVSAIGHDVGHPGVNNAFLVALKAPLAQLYNDNSVLEAFHCAAYSQILRHHWAVVFEDSDLRRLLIKSILATDMQVHFKYMTDLGNLQEKLHHNKGIDGWSDKVLEEYRTLVCGLLIKCADISNVARPFKIAAKWSDILQLEFAKQGEMERDVGIPTTLFGGPPELGNLTKLAVSQISFMNIFACPLFESVTDVLPSMQFAVNEIRSNQKIWKDNVERNSFLEEQGTVLNKSEPRQSPRSGSPDRNPAASPQMSHPEGLPASAQLPEPLNPSPITTLPRSNEAPCLPSTSRPPLENTSCHEDENVTLGAHLIEQPQSAASTNVYTSVQQLRSTPTQLQVGISVPPNPNNIENIPPDDNHASTSPFNEAVFLDNASASTAAGTRSSSGGGVGAESSHRGDKSAESDTSTSQRTHSGNFSRPMSTRHSVHASYARSSAPSAAPTLASTYLPTSPADTQATSFFTEGSDGANDVTDNVDLERPESGYISALTGNGFGGKVRGPTGGETKIGITRGMRGHGETDRAVRKKGSRFRLDFWKKKRSGEITSP